jgi:methylphosphotriester-DNA--protein-cysteine methyltransferase
MNEARTCKQCGKTKDVSEYYVSNHKGVAYPSHKCKRCDSDNASQWARDNPFQSHVNKVRRRSKLAGIPCDIDAEFLEEIWTGVCPIFHTKLNKPGHSTSADRVSKYTCSLDRIIPENGYVKGNVEWISNYANVIKQRATAEELQKVADHVAMREKEIARHAETD